MRKEKSFFIVAVISSILIFIIFQRKQNNEVGEISDEVKV